MDKTSLWLDVKWTDHRETKMSLQQAPTSIITMDLLWIRPLKNPLSLAHERVSPCIVNLGFPPYVHAPISTFHPN